MRRLTADEIATLENILAKYSVFRYVKYEMFVFITFLETYLPRLKNGRSKVIYFYYGKYKLAESEGQALCIKIKIPKMQGVRVFDFDACEGFLPDCISDWGLITDE